MNYGFIKTEAVSPDLRVADCRYNTEKIIEAMEAAGERGTQLIVFPELAVTAYTCGDLFLQTSLQQAAEEAEYFEELKVLFQSYADEAGYTMQITRVQGVRATIYVYYVSDYPFADGNRFPAFLKSVRFFFPHHQIVLRHVMNQEGHFLTREEYAQIKR